MMIKTRDGVALNVRTDGPDGTLPLILSNSLGTDLHMWDSLAAKLANTRKVVRYDKRGHGRSEVPAGPYTNAQLAEDVIDIMDALNIEQADFCGISMGGMAGQWLAANRPDRFRRVILANTVPHMDLDEIWNGRIETVNAGGMAAIEDAVLERWFTPAFRAGNDDAVAPILKMVQTVSPAGYTACCAAVRDLDIRSEIKTISIPVLVIAGTHDQATPPEQGRAIAAAIAGAQYLELDAAHLSNIEKPAEFERAVMAFVDG